MAQKKMKGLASYAVLECMKYSKDGRWQISYEELCQKFDIGLSDINQNKKLLEKELRQKKEIRELIMTEDCIEITCHLQCCRRCRDNPLDLLSVVGCNLYDEHEPAKRSPNEDITQALSM